ncbi:hypothetical protein DC522_31785 [Microvirga sp. KLBC 81]|uniref:glucosamine inositolphosphorylceramide transferase family protein n=1 Tax=Microvirga sp. KLBC 81 TaxID=1862707 RepID=UPI000D516B07|nr:hypothetical protein [Microvirga sp. KLBC 81]PVE20521.1 hypothetical protein DC522_31785 [Microvirga sp. KLBC 81]
MDPTIPRPLRIGLLLDSLTQPVWVNDVLAEVTRSGVAEVALVILNAAIEREAQERPPKARILARGSAWYRNRRLLPFAAYEKLDAWRYQAVNDPLREVDIRPHLLPCPVLRVMPRQSRFCDYFEDDAVHEIMAHQLDVALRFGFRILKGRALSIARFGVWSYHHGDNSINRGGPAGFWEVFEKYPRTGAVLQKLTEELDGGIVLGRCNSSTNPISPTANRANYYWQAAALLQRELRRVQLEGENAVLNWDHRKSWSPYSSPLYKAPGPIQTGQLLARVGFRLVRGKAQEWLRKGQWFVAYSFRPPEPGQEDVPQAILYRFKELLPPPDRYWADPFPVFADGRYYIFIEEHPFGSPVAHISVIEFDMSGAPGLPRPVLKRDYHLSYPFVFRWAGEWYMIPETLERNAVELFRATRFPDEWTSMGEMLSGIAATDPTLAEIDGRWWLFTGVVLPGATEATALFLFHGPTPLGPWTPHLHNPVKIDVQGARPAGRLFHHAGVWYRPGQDGSPTYGSATIVHRVQEISESRFHEEPVSRITPSWRPGLRGTHTLNAAGGLTVVDALRSIPRLRFLHRSKPR